MDKRFMLAEVKAVKDPTTGGEWEAVLSAPTVDRDGEVIAKGAFDPLPASIPIHAFHAFDDPIGRGEPFYEDDLLKARGGFASTARAQEIRTLVEEGVIANMSVGFMAAEREERDGVQTITSAELLEASFVSVPSNREAAVLMAKDYSEKVGARNNSTDAERLQSIHDLAVANGADCESKTVSTETSVKFAELPEVEVETEDEENPSAEEAVVSEDTAAESVEDSESDEEADLALRARALAILGES